MRNLIRDASKAAIACGFVFITVLLLTITPA